MKYLYDPPWIIKKLFSDFIWQSRIDQILLTFDDGPTPESTEKILNILAKRNLRAAFFCVGNNIKHYPHLAEKIIKSGHLLANHTFDHAVLTKLDEASISAEIDSFNHFVNDNLNYKVQYFRPPHGKFNFRINTILRKKSLTNVMWSLLTYDYKNDFSVVKNSIDKYLKKNSIVVFHDSIKSSAIIEQSLNYFIDAAERKGFTIGEPEACLKH